MTTVVLIHGGKSTIEKLKAVFPGADVQLAYREGLSASYDEKTGIAHDFPTLEAFMSEYAPSWSPGDPLVLLGFSAGGWALRWYLRDQGARELVSAAVFLDSTYCGDPCNPVNGLAGVVEFARLANAHPESHRLVMTFSQATAGPGRGAHAIEAAAGAGPGVFVRGYANADHGGQQGIVGPAISEELVAPWLSGVPSSSGGMGKLFALAALAILGGIALAKTRDRIRRWAST